MLINTFDSREQLAQGCAEKIAEGLAKGCAERGQASLAVAGGSTPSPTFRRLAAIDLPWPQITVTATDERLIPPDAALSNYRLIRDDLLFGPAAAASHIQLWSGDGSFQDAARRADEAVSSLLPFDISLIGMGEDGHIASLIPKSPALNLGLALDGAPAAIFVPEGEPTPVLPRLSLTLRALTDTRLVIVLVTGTAKLKVLETATENPALPIHHLLKQDRAPVQIFWAE